MTEETPSGAIFAGLKSLPKKKGLPPVNDWNPDLCGDIDMRICRDGRWLYNGSPIGRESMVRLFSTILRHDEDDCFYMVTPVEKVRIQVDDAPFLIIGMSVENDRIIFTTNVGDQVVLDEDHPIRVQEDSETSEPAPYIRVRDRLDGLIHRNVFYQLVEMARERKAPGRTELYISSMGNDFVIGHY